MSPLASLRRRFHRVLHLDEPPRRTAVAFALGTFIAFCPLYPHTALVLLCAWAFRLNVVALMAGALINNPWTLLPILGATLWTGMRLVGAPGMAALAWDGGSLGSLYAAVAPYAVPFVVGGLALGLAGAGLAYPAAYYVIVRQRGRRDRDRGPGAGCGPGAP